MPIHYTSSTQTFHLQSKQVSYIFRVLQNGQLGHLYYGKKLTHREDYSHLHRIEARSNTAAVYEGNLDFSLETIRQEFPSYGTTDFREPAFQVEQPDGSRITQFEFMDYAISAGKPKLEGLPAVYTEKDKEASTLIIRLHDDRLNMDIHLSYTIFEKTGVITRSSSFTNRGSDTVKLSKGMSLSVDMPDYDYEMVHLSGAWARERHVKTRQLEEGIQQIGSTRGISSAQHNPFFALKRPHTTEHTGEVFGFSLVYSGNFKAQVEVDHFGTSRAMIGLNDFDFSWQLQEGETFQTPEAVMVYSSSGMNGLSHAFHDLFSKRLVRGKWRDKERPVLINNWEGTYFNFTEDKIVEMAEQAKECGIELFVLDDGWFGKRDDDTTSLGDWSADERKLPNGVKGLADKVKAAGMDFGLWFEPEMISKESELYKAHPDWLLQAEGRRSSHGRNQFVLDFSRKEVVDHMYNQIADVLKGAPISYIKWDMNRPLTEIMSSGYPAERQQEIAHRYVLGVYDLYERLTSDFPDVLFESCASGGCRFDPGMLYYAPQTWTSDNTDAIERLKIQYGTSFLYPIKTMGAHVSDVPNHQVHRITSLETRARVSFFGNFGYELDITKEKDLSVLKDQVSFYKKHRTVLQEGRFYRLESPFEGDGNVTSWMVVDEHQQQAVAARYQVLEKPNSGLPRFYFKGLLEDVLYQVEGSDESFYGSELMHAGLPLQHKYTWKKQGDYQTTLLVLNAIK
ncbi:alpha-galactosidase [Sinobaca qinghaiensis]|uniref:Alpha-galactosidase n=1 Tax=Sinobaca qinghaiensis TaxID=342944 RepID=A0A419V7Z7_9BACL|nr:alpha-galactosidase [Sinobaca qinghaiensis]RKD76177.1 alpha-galactosidase [Sinobaca qinghaiensis]